MVNLGEGSLNTRLPMVMLKGLITLFTGPTNPITPQLEYGDIYVTISNYVPAQGTLTLSTPKNVPLVLSYNIPVSDYDLTVTIEPDHGDIAYFPGYQTVSLYGQTFEGYNLLV